jgi:hypothetical protein
MRIVIIAIVVILAAISGGVALLPMSMAADVASKQFPDFRFKDASGSLWDGKLSQVSFGQQFIGDLAVKTELLPLLTGKIAGKFGLAREGFSGETDLSYGLGDKVLQLKDLKLDGNTALVPGMPASIARAEGKFTLQLKDVKFTDNVCEAATGEVWTDALAKVTVKGWTGPELRGPVTCNGGKLQVQAGGKAATGEDVQASLNISQHLDMELTATVSNVTPAAAAALAEAGFTAEGDKLVLRQAMGGR